MRRVRIALVDTAWLAACRAESLTLASATLTGVEWRLQEFEPTD